jgi:hypothetical protein
MDWATCRRGSARRIAGRDRRCQHRGAGRLGVRPSEVPEEAPTGRWRIEDQNPSLWLASITRTGRDGSVPITMPATSFADIPMANRIPTAADRTAGYSLITRPRLTALTNDTGGVTTVAYSGVDASCAAGSFPTLSANTTTCYPDRWTAAGASSPVQDWFSLYTARTVTATDSSGGAPPMITSYTYAGAAWHFDDDTVSRSATRTWDQWRGFRTLTTRTGTAPDPITKTVDTYLQGMSGDPTVCTGFPCGPGATVTVTSSRGDTVDDADATAGVQFESIVDNGDSGGE